MVCSAAGWQGREKSVQKQFKKVDESSAANPLSEADCHQAEPFSPVLLLIVKHGLPDRV